jgi:hypothetical protein
MNESLSEELNEMFIKANVTQTINTMLECLLSKLNIGKINCENSTNCENVDACCFLMESVFICHGNEIKKLI